MAVEITFGSWLKNARKYQDLTQDELARRIGCSLMLIQKLEAGERRPSKQIAELLAACFGVSTDEHSDFVRFARSQQPCISPNENAPWRTFRRQVLNLPAPPAPLFGRQQEIATIGRQIAREHVRLLTLVGPPGIGKTRLAIEAAVQMGDAFADGIVFVSLAAIRDPDLVSTTIAHALSVKESGTHSHAENLKRHLADKRLLLVLDNLEQVVAAAGLLADLLSFCPWLQILATSRISLHIRPERQFHVTRLALPPPDATELDTLLSYSAVELFVDRAQAVDNGFGLDHENSRAVAEICARLDGLPLAIELVAAHVCSMTPQEMLAQLTHRLSLTADGPVDLPNRHQSLREAIDWSYDLLSADERALFMCLAIFVGGFTREMLEAVCGLGLSGPLLDSLIECLIDKSLVIKESRGGETRLMMLETIREYALEKLSGTEDVERVASRHAMQMCEIAEKAAPCLAGPDQVRWANCLHRDQDNLRAALRWACDHGDASLALRIANALFSFWYQEGWLDEGLRWFTQALELPASTRVAPSVRIKALCSAGYLAWSYADYETARRLALECRALSMELGDKRGIADALTVLANVATDCGDSTKAAELYEEDLALLRELGDQAGVASILNNLARIAYYRGEPARALPYYEETLSLRKAQGDRFNIALTLNNFGGALVDNLELERAREILEAGRALSQEPERPYFVIVYTLNHLGRAELFAGNYSRAEELLRESLAQARERQSKTGASYALLHLGILELRRGNPPAAEPVLREALLLQRQFEEKGVAIRFLDAMAVLFQAQGKLVQAATLFGTIEGICEGAGIGLPPAYAQEHTRNVDAVHLGLREQIWQAAWARGFGMSLAEAYEFALSD